MRRFLSLAFFLGGPLWAVPGRADPPPSVESELGVRYRIERIRVEGNRASSRGVILGRVPFRVGQWLNVEDPSLEATRLRLLATGFFADVELTLVRGRRRGWIELVVHVTERPTLRLDNLVLGQADGSLYGGLGLGDLNLFGSGMSATGAFVAGAGQRSFRFSVARPDWPSQGRRVELSLFHLHANEPIGPPGSLTSSCDSEESCQGPRIGYERWGGELGATFATTDRLALGVRSRLEWVRGQDVPWAASRDSTAPIELNLHRGTSVLASLEGRLVFDTRDDPFLPRRGARLWTSAEVATPLWVAGYTYARFVTRFERYVRLPWRHVFKVEAFGGLVIGGAPLFEQFFAGDLSDLMPSRALGLSFDDSSPPNLLGTAIALARYDDLAGRVAIEYAIPLHRSPRIVYGLDFFAGAGLWGLGSFRSLLHGTGREEGLQRVPVDLTFDVGFRMDTEVGVLGLSFSNLLGLIPFQGSSP